MEEFDQRNHKFIQEITDKIEDSGKQELVTNTEEELFADEDNEERIPAIEESVYKKFIKLVSTEKQEKLEEDLDVFLVEHQSTSKKLLVHISIQRNQSVDIASLPLSTTI